MKITCEIKLNLKTDEVIKKVKEARKLAVRDVVVDIANGAIKDSPFKTGNNRRRLAYQSEGMSQGVSSEGNVDGVELEEGQGAVFSTSGYGGLLETGTSKMEPRPYIKPNADQHFTAEKMADRIKKHLGES